MARRARKTNRRTKRRTTRKKSYVRATRGLARGFYSLNGRGKIVSGPHATQWDAAPDAKRNGGWVQYEPG